MTPQTFSKDIILPKLVDYFNAQDAETRTIAASDLPLFKVAVVLNGDGQEELIVGDTTPAVNESKYVGDATYTWVGVRDVPATATAADFFEVSRYIHTRAPSGGPVGGSGITEIPIVSGDTFESNLQTELYEGLQGASEFPNTLAIIYEPRQYLNEWDGEQADNIWLRLPAIDDQSTSANQLVRVRPAFVYKEREMRVVIDGSQPIHKVFGEFYEMLGAIIDDTTMISVVANPQTLRSSESSEYGGIQIALQSTDTFGVGMNCVPNIFLEFADPTQARTYLNTRSMDSGLEPDFGKMEWVLLDDSTIIPSDFYVELLVTICYKQVFRSSDKVIKVAPM